MSFWFYSLIALLVSASFLIWRLPKIGSFWRCLFIFIITQVVYLLWTSFLIFREMAQTGHGDPQLAAGWIAKLIVGSAIYSFITLVILSLIFYVLKFIHRTKPTKN